jgi:hypothetical protein
MSLDDDLTDAISDDQRDDKDVNGMLADVMQLSLTVRCTV